MIVGPWAIAERRERLARDFPEEVKAVEAAWAENVEPVEAMRAAIEAITDEMVDSRTIVGVRTPKEIHKALVESKSLGADLPIVPMPPGDSDEAGRILEEVING